MTEKLFKVKPHIKEHAGKTIKWADKDLPYEYGVSLFKDINTGELVKIYCDELLYLGRYLEVLEG